MSFPKVLGLIGFALVALGVRWLITPINHPNAPESQTLSVWIQLVVGVSLIAYAWRAGRKHAGH